MAHTLLLVALAMSGACAAPQAATSACLGLPNDGPRLLKGLPGSWQGKAVTTPIGEVAYDITFQTVDAKSVRGRSKTNGQAVHTWLFRSAADGSVRLDFHSTFGDSHAKGLCVVRTDPIRGWLFARGKPGFLEVWVKVSRATWGANISLGGKPHVRIETRRRAP